MDDLRGSAGRRSRYVGSENVTIDRREPDTANEPFHQRLRRGFIFQSQSRKWVSLCGAPDRSYVVHVPTRRPPSKKPLRMMVPSSRNHSQ